MKQFSTECLFRAAAIVVKTGKEPDHFMRITDSRGGAKVIMRWDDSAGLPLDDMNNGNLLVDPVEFKDVYIPLKNKVLNIVDEGE